MKVLRRLHKALFPIDMILSEVMVLYAVILLLAYTR